MKKLIALATFFVPTLLLASTGCAVDGDAAPEEGVDSSEEAASTPCKITRNQILSSVSGGRKKAIERGFVWFDKKVPYSQQKSYGGYRTDCSGFVSMCWETGTSYTTAEFITNKYKSYLLPGYESLLPGDALVHHKTYDNAHIVLFLGWNDAKHTSACVLEQASTDLDMQFRSRNVSALKSSSYKAIRANKLKSSTPSCVRQPCFAAGEEMEDGAADEEDGTEAEETQP